MLQQRPTLLDHFVTSGRCRCGDISRMTSSHAHLNNNCATTRHRGSADRRVCTGRVESMSMSGQWAGCTGVRHLAWPLLVLPYSAVSNAKMSGCTDGLNVKWKAPPLASHSECRVNAVRNLTRLVCAVGGHRDVKISHGAAHWSASHCVAVLGSPVVRLCVALEEALAAGISGMEQQGAVNNVIV